MLAICEQTQGNLEAAVGWLRKGIEAPGFPPEDAIGLRYDLGQLLRAQERHGGGPGGVPAGARAGSGLPGRGQADWMKRARCG